MPEIRVFFITNRNYLHDDPATFGTQFNPDGVAALRFGHAIFTVEGTAYQRAGIEVYPDSYTLNGEDKAPPPGSSAFMDALRTEMRNGRDTLIFIHGFGTTFARALETGAKIANELPHDVNVVVFSWPSDGTLVPYMSYYSDRDDARASGPALARAYLKLFDFIRQLREAEIQAMIDAGMTDLNHTELCQRCLHVLAHSMGNYVLRHGIQAIDAKNPRKLVRMFDQVILAAADEDDDAFELDDKLRILPTLARRITVYHNRNDRALIVSDQTKSNPDRLGSEGPRMLDLLPKKVVIVDCSRIAELADPVSAHSYIDNPSMAADLTAVLADKPDDEIRNREMLRAGRAYRIKK